MYGLVNKGLQRLIASQHGQVIWEQVAQRAGAPRVFVSMESYPDSITYDVVDAACEILAIAPETLLRRLGQFWVIHTAHEGYGSLFDIWGADLAAFLRNLDLMHSCIKTTMPALEPPRFSTCDLPDGRIRLTYRSHRDGFAPMVVGLIEGLAEKFKTSVSIEHVVRRADAGHDEFLLTLAND